MSIDPDASINPGPVHSNVTVIVVDVRNPGNELYKELLPYICGRANPASSSQQHLTEKPAKSPGRLLTLEEELLPYVCGRAKPRSQTRSHAVVETAVTEKPYHVPTRHMPDIVSNPHSKEA